ncbi:hypothetical protein [Kitasatospora sp. MBT63]|uniref:hypothetical protein n=1 Tax=Kitasatospora sp. MBT63 TaxID=1444768 RepID=UPI00053AE158|nr:hypothetical protein [Kitasatospora sp. MBT63]
MRRIITATCLLVTTAALAGCTSTGSRDAGAAASGAAATPTAVPATGAATGTTGASPTAGGGAVRVWATNSTQFTVVTSAFIALASTIMKAPGDDQAIGKACTAMAAHVGGVQPEAGAPAEWEQALADLQRISKSCDAVTSGNPGARAQLDADFTSATVHLKAVTDHL